MDKTPKENESSANGVKNEKRFLARSVPKSNIMIGFIQSMNELGMFHPNTT